jgi:hypothetical protein
MKEEPIWIVCKPETDDWHNQTIELHIESQKTSIHGMASAHVERHPTDENKRCVWIELIQEPGIVLPDSGPHPLHQIEVNHIRPHPDSSKARYLCEFQYGEG